MSESGATHCETFKWLRYLTTDTSYYLKKDGYLTLHVHLITSKGATPDYISSQIYQVGPNDTTAGLWEFTSFEDMTEWIVNYFTN